MLQEKQSNGLIPFHPTVSINTQLHDDVRTGKYRQPSHKTAKKTMKLERGNPSRRQQGTELRLSHICQSCVVSPARYRSVNNNGGLRSPSTGDSQTLWPDVQRWMTVRLICIWSLTLQFCRHDNWCLNVVLWCLAVKKWQFPPCSHSIPTLLLRQKFLHFLCSFHAILNISMSIFCSGHCAAWTHHVKNVQQDWDWHWHDVTLHTTGCAVQERTFAGTTSQKIKL
jgi:hypothetical protein